MELLHNEIVQLFRAFIGQFFGRVEVFQHIPQVASAYPVNAAAAQKITEKLFKIDARTAVKKLSSRYLLFGDLGCAEEGRTVHKADLLLGREMSFRHGVCSFRLCLYW